RVALVELLFQIGQFVAAQRAALRVAGTAHVRFSFRRMTACVTAPILAGLTAAVRPFVYGCVRAGRTAAKPRAAAAISGSARRPARRSCGRRRAVALSLLRRRWQGVARPPRCRTFISFAEGRP